MREGLPAAGRCAALALCAPDIPALQPFPVGRGHFVTHRHSGGVGLAEREGFESLRPNNLKASLHVLLSCCERLRTEIR